MSCGHWVLLLGQVIVLEASTLRQPFANDAIPALGIAKL